MECNLGPTVLLTTTCWWHFASRLALSMVEAGCRVSAICPRGHSLHFVPHMEGIFYYPVWRVSSVLSQIILTVEPSIIVPCDDRAVLHLHRLHEVERRKGGGQVARIVEQSIGASGSFSTVVGRQALIERAGKYKLATPPSQSLRCLEDIDKFVTAHGFPIVVKLDSSWGGNGVVIAKTLQEARSAFQRLSRPCPFWLALKLRLVNRDPYWLPDVLRRSPGVISTQKFIEGRQANCAVFCWQGRVLAGTAVEVLLTQNPRAPAAVVRLADQSEMLRVAKILVADLQLSGFIGLDFIISGDTNVHFLLEMNPRATPLAHVRVKAGGDLVGALCEALSWRKLSTAQEIESEIIAYFPFDTQGHTEHDGLGTPHCDIPIGAPALVAEMLRESWRNRGLLARIFYSVRRSHAVQDWAKLPR